MVKIIGYIDKDGTFHDDEYETTKKNTAKNTVTTSTAPAMSVVANQVQPTVTTQPVFNEPTTPTTQPAVQETKKQTKKEQKSLKDAIKAYGDVIKNSAVKNHGLSVSNVISDLANAYDARRNIAASVPGVGKVYDTGTKTLGNIATNMGEGALRTGEGVLDTLNDWSDAINNPLTYQANKAAYGKKVADKALKEAQKSQEDFLKSDLVNQMMESTGYNEVLPQWQQNSLVNRENFGGQVAQGVGGMVPSLLAGQYLGFAPNMTSLEGLSGAQKAAAMAGNVGKTYLSQLPANAILGASSYGSGLQEALNDGASRNRARAYGLANAAIEQGTEMLTGGIPGLEGRGGIDQFIDPLIGKTGGYLNPLLKAGYSALGEGLEESTGTYLDALAKQGILGQDIDWNQVNREALQSGLVGAATGAILNAPSNLQNFSEAREEQIANKEKTQKYDNQLKDIEIKDNTPKESSEPYSPIVNKINDTLQKVQGAGEGEEYTGLIKQPTMREIVSSEKQAQNDYLNDKINEMKTNKNVDNTQEKGYNKGVKEEGVQNDFRTIQEESRRKLSDKSWGDSSKAADENLRGRLRGTLSEELKRRGYSDSNNDGILRLESKGNQFTLHKNVDGETFHDVFEIARAHTDNGELVDLHPIETNEDSTGYNDMTNYISDDGMQGFSITKDGDVVSVFNADPTRKGFLRSTIDEINNNGKTLDCYNSNKQALNEIYSKVFGWKTTSVMDHNMEYDHDNIAKNHGNPPVSFMVNPNQLKENVTDADLNKKFGKDQYSEAVAYREALMKDGKGDKSDFIFGEDGYFKGMKEGTSDSSFSNEVTPESLTAENDYFDKAQNKAAVKEEPVIKTKAEEQQHLVDNGVAEDKAKILTEMPKPEKKSISERIKEGKATLREEFDYFKRNVVDKGEAIYTLAKKTKNNLLYAKYDKRGTTTGEANYDIGVAQTDLKGEKFNNFTDAKGNKKTMSLNQIWEGIDPAVGNEYIGHYLNVDRYKQVNAEGRKLIAELENEVKAGKMTQQEMDEELKNYNINKYVISPNFTDKMSMEKIKELEAVHPELKIFGKNIWQYGKNQLQNMVDANIVSKEKAKQWMKETPHYVRLQREIPKGSTSTIVFDDKGNARVNQQIKEFTGSTLNILPFKETMAQYTLDVRNSIRDNIFAQELAKTLGVSSTGDVVSDIDEIMGVNPDLIKDNGDGTYSFTFFNQGKKTTIPITQGIYESLQPNKHYEFEDKRPFKAIRKVDNIRKALLTDKNPLFLATNMMKDAFDAPLNSKYPELLLKNYPRAFYEIVLRGGKGANYQQYQALGGLQNTYFENQEFQKSRSKYNPIGWIEKANNAIEQLPRLAEFISTMERTGDVDQAMYNAAEITTNFKRGGDFAKAANRNGVTFLNASIQGFSKQVRNFTDIFSTTDGKISVDGKRAVQMLGKVLALGIAPGLLNDLAWEDDDDYKDLQDYIKDNYYLIAKTKDGTWVRIPKGRAVSIFQSAARRTKYAIRGEKGTFKGFGQLISNQIAPNNPLENNILSPWFDVARNKSWSGNDIVSDYLEENFDPDLQYDAKTSEFSKWLGKTFNISPKKADYIIDQYSGALGDIFLPMNTKYAENQSDNFAIQLLWNPIRGKFSTDSTYSNKTVGEYYDLKEKVIKKGNRPEASNLDKAKKDYIDGKYSDINSHISELYTKQRELQNSDLSNAEKYKQNKEIQKELIGFMKQTTKDLDNATEENGVVSIGEKNVCTK